MGYDKTQRINTVRAAHLCETVVRDHHQWDKDEEKRAGDCHCDQHEQRLEGTQDEV